jgi:hypothetical protein
MALLIKKCVKTTKRLSNETISSPYDDRLDKKDGGALIGPPTSRSR